MTHKPRVHGTIPFSEMTFADKVAECRAAIGRLEDQLEANRQSRNMSYVISKSSYEALKRWNNTLTALKNDPQYLLLKPGQRWYR